jgi:transposase
LTDADHVLHGRYDKVDLPVVRPVVTRVERYAGHCPCCHGVTLAAVPEGMQEGTPFSVNIMAPALYLRFTHAISYQRLSRMFLHLFALRISEGALDAMFQRAKPCFDNEVAAMLARLRRPRSVCSDETTVRIDGRTHWNRVFQNEQVVIHAIRNSRAASVVTEVLDGHRPTIWVSDLYSAQQGHAYLWQVPGASVARLQIRHRGGRRNLRAPHEGAAAASGRVGPSSGRPGREHTSHLPATA